MNMLQSYLVCYFADELVVMQNRIQDAIDCYHKALALRPEDTLVAEMLTLAMQDSAKTEYSF